MQLISFVSLVLLGIFVLSNQSIEARISYQDYHVLSINISQQHEIGLLQQQAEFLDFWSLPNTLDSVATVMVAPKQLSDFTALLTSEAIDFAVITSDLEQLFENERYYQKLAQTRRMQRTPEVPLNYYARHLEINTYLDNLADRYPKTVSVQSAGQSYENRTLKYIRISNGDGRTGKKKIFLDAGIHAREWIAPATALYVVHQLVEQADKNQDLLANIDWIVLPCVNADGYEHSHQVDRMWRKTRQPNAKSQCPGTDGNRNFGFEWGGAGASASECSDTYRGPAAFSEPETRAVRDIMLAVQDSCKFYLTLHSYGQYLLYPWGYTPKLPENWRDLDEVARVGAAAIRNATGTRYTVGSSTNVLYQAAGGSDDYALGAHGIPISFTMELPGGGWWGFDPPVSEIEASVKESWIGIRAMAIEVDEKYPV